MARRGAWYALFPSGRVILSPTSCSIPGADPGLSRGDFSDVDPIPGIARGPRGRRAEGGGDKQGRRIHKSLLNLGLMAFHASHVSARFPWGMVRGLLGHQGLETTFGGFPGARSDLPCAANGSHPDASCGWKIWCTHRASLASGSRSGNRTGWLTEIVWLRASESVLSPEQT
jgi:hypothetical protein